MILKTFEDANDQIKNDRQLRSYFAMLIVNCQPSNPKDLFEKCLDKLFPPPVARDRDEPLLSEFERKQTVLRDLEYYLRELGTTCE